MGKTSIEWTDHSWPVVNGCRRVSPGCENCYAERLISTRLRKTPKYEGLATYGEHGPRWTGKSRLWAPDLMMPLRLKKPQRIFVADMGDLFAESVSNEEIAAVFGAMSTTRRHTFQVLTKRATRMREWFEWVTKKSGADEEHFLGHAFNDHPGFDTSAFFRDPEERFGRENVWPLPNVHLGVSVEDQQRADERIPELLATPAAVRWISAEPLLERISIWAFLKGTHRDASLKALRSPEMPGLDWVVVGGESGPGARPFDIAWARDIVKQCKDAHVPVFVKQLGAKPYDAITPDTTGMGGIGLALKDRKGGTMSEWPHELRVRLFPEVTP